METNPKPRMGLGTDALVCVVGISVLVLVGGLPLASSTEMVQTTAPQQKPVFRSRTDLVHLDISVLDQSRRPVRGLTKEDFVVLENGKPQAVSIFDAIDVPGHVEPPVGWMRDVTPDVTTNETKLTRLWLVVVDDANVACNKSDRPYQIKVSKQSVMDVIDRFGPEDLVTIVFTADSRPAQDFTNDRTRLIRTLDNYNPCWAMNPEQAEQFQIANLYTLRNVIDTLIAVPHKRKGMIWISNGPFLPEGFVVVPKQAPGPRGGTMAGSMAITRKIEVSKEIFEVARRANIPIYPVPPTGVDDHPNDTLITFANQTGGHVYVNSNDYARVVDQIFEENSSYYLVGYYPTNTKADGSVRKIEVQVNRPGVEVRTRNGYTASKPGDRPPANTNEALRRATATPVSVQELPLRATAAPFAISGKSNLAAVAIAIGMQPGPEALATSARISATTELRVTAFTTEGDNKATQQQTQTVTFRGGPRASGYDVLSRVDLPPGRFRLRIAAHHDEAAMIGTVMVDVVVPDFSKDRASMSGVIIGLVPDRPSSPRDLLLDVTPILPTAQREFRQYDVATSRVVLYQKDSKALVPAQMSVRIRDVKDAVVVQEDFTIEASQFTTKNAPAASEFQYRLPLDRLAVGPYLLTFEAAVGETSLRRDVQFTVK